MLGGAGPLCPGTSDINFLGDLKGVVDLYTEVANCAFNLGNGRAKIACTQVCSATVDQRRFGSTHRMRGEFAGIEANAGLIPAGHTGASSRARLDLGVLDTGIRRACARYREVVVESLSRGLSQLKANWPTSLPQPIVAQSMA